MTGARLVIPVPRRRTTVPVSVVRPIQEMQEARGGNYH